MGVVSCGTTMLDQGVFQNIGAVTWDTTAKTSGFTTVSGNGYFVNTTSAAITATLPASPSAGDIVGIQDYAGTSGTNAITIGRNGSNINGDASDLLIEKSDAAAVLIYVDATEGWKAITTSSTSDLAPERLYISATGGTITCCGNFKVHTFTGPGTFCVSCAGNACGSNEFSYVVVAGGGAGGATCSGGGGGAGGFREGKSPQTPYTASPLDAGSGITATVQGYPVVVGGGGPGTNPFTGPSCNGTRGNNGSNSSVFGKTATGGGGGGGGGPTTFPGNNGGSGGGGGHNAGSGGTGNSPSVSPAQGNNGGASTPGISPAPSDAGGAGGGATAIGQSGSSGHAGGAGATSSINGTPTARAGGGGGSNRCGGNSADTAGGVGGGGRGGFGSRPGPIGESEGLDGTANTGGGGGGGKPNSLNPGPTRIYGGGGSGGSGVVIVRYKYQN